jgi:hypothetical protein
VMNRITTKMCFIKNLLTEFFVLWHYYAVFKPYHTLIVFLETFGFCNNCPLRQNFPRTKSSTKMTFVFPGYISNRTPRNE